MKSDIDLLSYTHDRDSHYKDTADEIYNLINNYTDQEDLLVLYNYFEQRYGLPQRAVKQKIRQHLGRSYLFKRKKFKSRLHVRNIPKYIFLYGALIYALFFTKKNKIENYTLIIDNIESQHELVRFEKLLNLVGANKVLCITKNIDISEDFPGYNFVNTKLFRNFKMKDLLGVISSEIFTGIRTVLRVSIKTRVNLFPIALQIIHSYLNFKSIFESNKAQYMIQERHYDTNSIKNYLFKQLGGVASTTIQKNIFQNDPINYYMDIDILFSLGKSGYEDMLHYGGCVSSVKPVGSMFMEYYWFDKKPSIEKKYDIAILGINTSNEYDRLDSYSDFMDDYYSLSRWAAKLSLERPDFKIVLVHHASAGEDFIESDILKGSNVEVLNKNIDSYKTAFSSKCAITYGSTMGYELNAHHLDTFFVDPGYRCSFLPILGDGAIDKMRIKSYEEFCLVMDEVVCKDAKFVSNTETDAWCMESSEVARKICNLLIRTGD